ncbi:PLP-dependent aminotransferase family protein [Nguyenibacter vanlangensis]|uniref:PLP-dependent aminotransferase family protein n=1 Tax=Nguyenibacter vanlangensis TaxID=1216886 RepID=A0ABZ3D1E2_9PROT
MDLPLYRSVARRLSEGIKQAGLNPGARLPSVRTLAKQYNVSHLTAVQALQSLESEGLIFARPRSGYYVATPELQGPKRRVKVIWPNPLPELDPQARDHLAMVGAPCAARLDLAVGEPELYPVKRFNVILRRLAYQQPSLVSEHTRGMGNLGLRLTVAQQALQYACELDPDELVVTNGCVEALNLALRAVTKPGDIIAVETPTYFALLQMLRALELIPLPIPCAAPNGMDIEILRKKIKFVPIKAVVTIANGNNPVGTVASDENKRGLVRLLSDLNIPLIEDDIFGDVCFQEGRPRPVKSFDRTGGVILCSGYSKSLCPGLRVGWVAGGKYAERIKLLKYTTSMATAELQQAVVKEMLSSGSYTKHLRVLRRDLLGHQKMLREWVLESFPKGTEISEPAGGFVLWVRLPQRDGMKVTSRALFAPAREEGIGFAPGHLFGVTGEFDEYLRLNSGCRLTPMLQSSVSRLGQLYI